MAVSRTSGSARRNPQLTDELTMIKEQLPDGIVITASKNTTPQIMPLVNVDLQNITSKDQEPGEILTHETR